MTSSVLLLATIGGLISFLSTSLGTLLSLSTWKAPSFFKFKFSIDFALGLMLSAVAFSLVGPAATQLLNNPVLLIVNFSGFVLGAAVIQSLKHFIERNETEKSKASSSQLMLALALMIHNFPEGLASGASLAGLSFSSAVPILSSISLQNIPEGLLMVICLKAMGWSPQRAFLGGIASGLVELAGGIASGFAMAWTSQALPFILMFAGGAMFTSVMIELREKGNFTEQLKKPEFVVGLFMIPVLNSIVS